VLFRSEAGCYKCLLEIREANSLRPASQTDSQLVILEIGRAGSTRLIDNLAFDLAS